MARFYGTLRADGKTTVSTKTAQGHLHVECQSMTADIVVQQWSPDPNSSTDMVQISVRSHKNGVEDPITIPLFRGPIRDLLTEEGRGAIVRTFAHDALERENRRAK